MRRFAFYLAVFFFVFGPRLAVFDFHSAAVICASIGGVYQMWRGSVLPYEFKALLFSYWPIIFYASLVSILYGAADPTIAWVYLKLVIYLLGAWALVVLAQRLFGSNFSNELFLSIWTAGVFNGFFALVMIVMPRLRHSVAPLLELGGKEHWVESGYRSFDISMGGGAIASIVFVILLFGGFVGRKAIKNNVILVVGSYILAIAVILTGRTGTVLMIVGLLSAGFWLFSCALVGKVKFRRFVSVVSYVLFPLSIVPVFLLLSESGDTYSVIIDSVVPWAFEGLRFSQEGVVAVETNTSLSNLLDKMFFLPSNDATLVFGVSNAGRSEYLPYLPTDVGYLRVLNAVGLVGLTLAALPFLVVGAAAASRLFESIESWPLIIMLGVLLIVNAKELVIAPRGGAAILAIWYCSLALQSVYSGCEQEETMQNPPMQIVKNI